LVCRLAGHDMPRICRIGYTVKICDETAMAMGGCALGGYGILIHDNWRRGIRRKIS
jgi:hypothetical protein